MGGPGRGRPEKTKAPRLEAATLALPCANGPFHQRSPGGVVPRPPSLELCVLPIDDGHPRKRNRTSRASSFTRYGRCIPADRHGVPAGPSQGGHNHTRSSAEPSAPGHGPCQQTGNGAEGARTPDLCNANAALSQLSYSPKVPGCPEGLPEHCLVSHPQGKPSRSLPDAGKSSKSPARRNASRAPAVQGT